MSLSLLLASIAASAIAVFAGWHRDRTKDGHNVQVLRAIRISAICSLVVVCLAGLNQYYFNKQATELRTAQLRLSVLNDLAKYRIAMFDDYLVLVQRSATVFNYVSFETARKSSPGASVAIHEWEAYAAPALKDELNEARVAFARLQARAREVLIQDATFPAMVPPKLVEWAARTLELHFEDLPRIANAYKVTEESKQYAELLGLAIGTTTSEMISTAKEISR